MASRRLEQESFRKRKNNFIRRAHEISDRYKVKVWICIRKENGQFYLYNSDPDHVGWPPSAEQLKSAYPVPIVKTPQDFVPRKQNVERRQANKTLPSLPGRLPKPPVLEYTQEEIFSGKLLDKYKHSGELAERS